MALSVSGIARRRSIAPAERYRTPPRANSGWRARLSCASPSPLDRGADDDPGCRSINHRQKIFKLPIIYSHRFIQVIPYIKNAGSYGTTAKIEHLSRPAATPRADLVDDEREIGNGVIVTLRLGRSFDPSCDNLVDGEGTPHQAFGTPSSRPGLWRAFDG